MQNITAVLEKFCVPITNGGGSRVVVCHIVFSLLVGLPEEPRVVRPLSNSINQTLSRHTGMVLQAMYVLRIYSNLIRCHHAQVIFSVIQLWHVIHHYWLPMRRGLISCRANSVQVPEFCNVV